MVTSPQDPQGIRFTRTLPAEDAYLRLFESTGWNEMYGQSGENLLRAVGRSWVAVSAYEEDLLVGSGRVLSDGVQYAVLFDVIVLPSHQGRGIGAALVRRLLSHCEQAGVRDVLLFAAKGTADFYRRFGFRSRPDAAPGMLLRRGADPGHPGGAEVATDRS